MSFPAWAWPEAWQGQEFPDLGVWGSPKVPRARMGAGRGRRGLVCHRSQVFPQASRGRPMTPETPALCGTSCGPGLPGGQHRRRLGLSWPSRGCLEVPPGCGHKCGRPGGEGWWHLGLKDLGHHSATGERGRGAVCSGRPCGWRGRRPVLPPGSGQSAHLGDQGGSHLSPEGAGWLTGKETPTVAEGVA